MSPFSRPIKPPVEGDVLPAVTVPIPPESFAPERASESELEYYGFPPRPDQRIQPEVFAAWLKAVPASKQRIVPKLVRTNRYHGPARMGATMGNGAQTSNNRSGVHVSALTNYISTCMSNCFAVTRGGILSTSPNTTVTFYPAPGIQLTMLDNSGNPISYPTLPGSSAIRFQDEGSAR